MTIKCFSSSGKSMLIPRVVSFKMKFTKHCRKRFRLTFEIFSGNVYYLKQWPYENDHSNSISKVELHKSTFQIPHSFGFEFSFTFSLENIYFHFFYLYEAICWRNHNIKFIWNVFFMLKIMFI